MGRDNSNKPRHTTAERIAFLGTCVVACIAIIFTSLTECSQHGQEATAATAPSTFDSVKAATAGLRGDTVRKKSRKKRGAKSDSTRRKRKKKTPSAPKNISPKARNYYLVPETETPADANTRP